MSIEEAREALMQRVVNVVFKEAVASDMDAIDKIQWDVFHGEQEIPEELLPIAEEKNAKWFVAVVQNEEVRSDMDGCAAESCGEVIGTVAYWKEGAETHWGRFAVLPEFRGSGIGKKFAAYSMSEIFAHGIDTVYMEARETTVHIICSLGGKVTGKPVPFFVGTVTPVELHKADFIPEII